MGGNTVELVTLILVIIDTLLLLGGFFWRRP
jgi:hypothetical protein